MRIRAVVVGACGRMGSLMAVAVKTAADFELVGLVERPDHPLIGRPIAVEATPGSVSQHGEDKQVLLSADLSRLIEQTDVVIEFSTPSATLRHVKLCADSRKPMVIGTTGFAEGERVAIEDAARWIPIVLSANMSIGMNVVLRVAGELAVMLGNGFDVEVIETHHRWKKDAPSGTALALHKAICAAKGWNLETSAVYGRRGRDVVRTPEEIGLHAVRAGGVVGEHRVLFCGRNECVELTHRVQSREAFAEGALLAARFVVGKVPKLYSMQDVISSALRVP